MSKKNFIDWWPPRAIVYNYDQIVWVIQNLEFFCDGRWPPDPHSSYEDKGVGHKKYRHRAYFEDAVCIRAELSWRLNQCGADGNLLVARLRGFDNIIVENLSQECRNALAYISGNKRKQITYWEFIKQTT